MIVARAVVLASSTNNSSGIPMKKSIFEKMFMNYDKYSLPPRNKDNQRTVDVKVSIREIFDISERDESLNIQYLFQLKWNDTRLYFVPFVEDGELKTVITIPLEIVQQEGEVKTNTCYKSGTGWLVSKGRLV